MKTITVQGVVFQVETETDDGAGKPWDRECGHGPVRARQLYTGGLWKRPGERILCGGLVYRFAEAVKIARRDGWGLSDTQRESLAELIGRTPTRGDTAAEAARLDFERLRAWCNDEWHYVGVTVTAPNGDTESLWGIESDSGDYLDTVARELAEELAPRVIEEQAREAAHAAMPARLALALLQYFDCDRSRDNAGDTPANTARVLFGDYFDMLARTAAQRELTELEAQALAAIKGVS